VVVARQLAGTGAFDPTREAGFWRHGYGIDVELVVERLDRARDGADGHLGDRDRVAMNPERVLAHESRTSFRLVGGMRGAMLPGR
jgi:hypothetical protein